MISQELKQFLQENKGLMNQNTKESWKQIYEKLSGRYYIGKFTQTILEAKINDPAAIMGCIPEQYLHDSNINSYEIPNNVMSIGSHAFSGCFRLTSVTIPDKVTSIGNYAFFYCTNLTNLVIPDSVTSIGSSAFYRCNRLTRVEIPSSVIIIGRDAFYDCDNLTEVQFKGTKKDALAKLKAKNISWKEGSSIQKIICTDGVIEL